MMAKGKRLNAFAVDKANQWRLKKLEELEERPILSLSFKERHLLKYLLDWQIAKAEGNNEDTNR